MTGTCDGCEKTRNLTPTADGTAMMCDDCHLAAKETAADQAAWYDQDR